jgi:hypothetical protein
MSEHRATIDWKRSSADFTYMTYNRAHDWNFKAATVAASATKEYRGDENRVNPEEALVAALSSCHLLTFLAVAAKRKLSIDSYRDEAADRVVRRRDRVGRRLGENAPRCARRVLHRELREDRSRRGAAALNRADRELRSFAASAASQSATVPERLSCTASARCRRRRISP